MRRAGRQRSRPTQAIDPRLPAQPIREAADG